jgi:protein phosphatase
LGDYVDRGAHSLETILLLMALKVTYPTQVHLIRGNHEDICVNEAFGFMEECAEKCDQDPEEEGSVFRTINRAFEWMPLAALV